MVRAAPLLGELAGSVGRGGVGMGRVGLGELGQRSVAYDVGTLHTMAASLMVSMRINWGAAFGCLSAFGFGRCVCCARDVFGYLAPVRSMR